MSHPVSSWTLERGWVFRSDHLTHGDVMPDAQGNPVVTIDPDRGAGPSSDLTRAQAHYVVERTEGASCDHTYECCYFYDIFARRLSADGSYDPDGECVHLPLLAGKPWALDTVELIGQMNHGWSAMTATLPKTP